MKNYRLAFLKDSIRQLKIASVILLCIISHQVTAQIVTYSFNGSIGNEQDLAPDAQPTDATASNMRRGPGVVPSEFSNGFSARNWTTNSILNTDDYYEFTIDPGCGFSLTLSSLVLDERYNNIDSDDDYNWVVRSSLDDFSSDIGTPFTVNAVTSTDPGTTTGNVIDLSGGTFDNLDRAVTFRFYAYSLEDTGMEWGIDNVDLNGSLSLLTGTDLHTVNFEADGCGYEAVNAGQDNNNQYFLRFNKKDEESRPGIGNHELSNTPLTNVQGDYYWALEANEDLDASMDQAGQVIFPPLASPLDVTSFHNLTVRLLIGAPGNPGQYDATDSLAVQYTYDAGTNYTTIGAFYGTGTSPFYQDTDLDGNANVSGSNELDQNLREFAFNIPKSGLDLNVRVIAYTTGGEEEVVFDNIRIQGDTDTRQPVVSEPIDDDQRLRGGVTSTSTVQSDEFSDIYLVLSGQPASSVSQINTAVSNNNAFRAVNNAEANTPYFVTPLTTLNDGVYDIVAVDLAGNVSAILPGWLTVDNTAPIISSIARQSPMSSSTTATTVTFRVTFNEDVINVDANDFELAGTASGTISTINGISASEYDVVVDPVSGNGDILDLDLAGGQNIINVAGIAFAGAISSEDNYTVDNVAPSVTSIVRQSPTDEFTNSNTVTFRVTFDEPVTQVNLADFALSFTNTATGSLNSVTDNSPTEYDIEVNGISGDGTLDLNFDPSQDIIDALGNSFGVSVGPEDTYTIDNIAPEVTSISRQTPAASTTNATTVTFRVIFDEDVVNVDPTDFDLSGSALGSINAVIPSSATVYDVEVINVSGDRENLNLDFNGGQNIQDLAENNFGGTVDAEEEYNIDTVIPEVTSIARENPSNQNTTATSVTFRVTFNEDVNNVDANDFDLSGTASGVIGTPSIISASVYDVTITSVSGNSETLNLDFAGGQNIEDLAGNTFDGTINGEEDYNIDNISPRVTSILRQSPSASPTNALSVTFRVTFDENVSNVDITDFTLSGPAGGTIDAVNTVLASVYDVVIDPVSGDGALNLDFASGQDIADGLANRLINTNTISPEEQYIIDNTGPEIQSITTLSSDPTSSGTATFRVTFNENVNDVDVLDFSLSASSEIIGTPIVSNVSVTNAEVDVTASGFDLNDASPSGTLGLTLLVGGTLTDDLGNDNTIASVAGTNESFTVINPEPAEDIVILSSTGQTSGSIELSWTNSLVNQIAYQHLILVRESGAFPSVTDGNFIADDLDLSDRRLAINVGHGISTFNVTGLNSGTQYDFRIYPYTNDGTNVLYKTDNPVTLSVTTLVASFTTINFVSAATSVSSLTTANTGAVAPQQDAVANFVFTIHDDGGITDNSIADNAKTEFTQLIITRNPASDITDWTTVLAGAELSDDDGNRETGIISADNILFSGLSHGNEQIGEVDDDEIKTYTLKVWFLSPLPDGVDNQDLVFELDASDIINNLQLIAGSSGIDPASNSVQSGDNNNVITVEATDLAWTIDPTNPSPIGVLANFTTTPRVTATDVNGNRDVDYVGTVLTLTNTGSIPMNNAPTTSSSFLAGNLDFPSNFSYGDAGNGTLSITTSGLSSTPTPSSNVTVSYSNRTTITEGPLTEPSTIPSTQTSFATVSLDFTITDDNGPGVDDNVPTNITQIVITAEGGTNTLTTNWSDVIDQAQLEGPLTSIFSSSIDNNSITFNLPAAMGRIDDQGSKTYELSIALKSNITGGMDDLVDNLHINFNVTDVEVTTAPFSSTFATSQSVTSGATNNEIDVSATRLAFQQQPSNTFVNEIMAPQVVLEANDDNGNRDKDYTGNLNITSSGSLNSPVTASLTNGVGNTTNIIHDAISGGLELTASEAVPTLSTSNITSAPFDVLAGINESDIVVPVFTYNENILYAQFTVGPVSNANPKVFEFDIRDGASGATATDIDNSPTNVTRLEFNVGNIGFLSEVGLFDATNSLIATAPTTSNPITFDLSGSPVVVPDDGSVTLHLRALFSANVIDNEQVTFTVSSAQASIDGSTFESADGAPTGGSAATSSIDGDRNRVEVVADTLVFNNIPGASLNTSFLPVIQVNALDSLDNLDLDFNEGISGYSNQSTTPATSLATIDDPSGNFSGGIFQFPAGFQFTEAGDGVTITLQTPRFDGSPRPEAISNPFNITSSSNSNIRLSSSQPERINYIDYLSDNITGAADAFELARFMIKDGGNTGGTDMDGANTILDEITFDISNADNINKIAIYNGITEVSEQAGGSSPITFNGLAPDLVALDDDSTEFIVYVTFNSTNVVDLEGQQITITNAVENGGSQFEFDEAGETNGVGAQTADTLNIIDVVANQYIFNQQPSPIEGVNIDWSAVPIYPEVAAVDAQGLTDLEINESISPGTFSIATPSTGGASITCSSCAFSNGVMDLAALRYTSTGNGTLTVSDLAGRSISEGSSIAVDIVNTRFAPLTNGIAPATLQANDGNLAIFGFRVRSVSQTIAQPILEGFTVRFGTRAFDNIRIFESSDNTFDNAFVETLIDNSTNPGFNLAENANEIVVTNLNEDLSDGSAKYFFVVVDVSPTADQNTPIVTPTLSDLDIQITNGSITGFNFTGNTFEFLDVSPPQILDRSPEGDNTDPNSSIAIRFNEAVTPLDSIVRVFAASDQTLAASYRLNSGSPDSTTFEFTLDAGGLGNDTDYYVNIAEGNVTNMTGFVDDADPVNGFAGITNTTGWTFRTADANPPVFVVNPSAEFIFTEGFDVKVQIDEPGRIYYAVVRDSQPNITEAEHVIDPLDTRGDGNPYPGTVIVSDSIDIALGFDDNYISVTGLSNNENYVVYVIAVDLAGNLMNDTAPGVPFAVNATTLSSSPSSQIIISSPSAALCIGNFQEITEPIHILEGENSDFADGNGQTLNLTLPANFEFNLDSIPVVSFLGDGNITNAQATLLNSTVVQIDYDVNNTNALDRLTLRGLYVRANTGASGGDIVRLGGSAVQDGSMDGTVHGSISVDPEVPALFDPNLPRTAGNNETRFALIADASISSSGFNTFSGQGVFGDTLFIPIAGIGTHPITLTHTTENGCVSSVTEDFTIFDNSQVVGGLGVNYCTNDLQPFTIVGSNNQSGFDLIELTVDPNSTDPSINTTNIVVDNGNSSWTIDFNGAGIGQVGFNARFRNRSNGIVDTRPRTQTVTISDPPTLSLDLINNPGPNNDFVNFCEEGDLIEITGAITNRDPSAMYVESIFMDINADDILGDDQTGLTDNGDGTATINVIDLANNTGFNFGDPIDIIYQVSNNTTTCTQMIEYRIFVNPKPSAAINNDRGCVGIPLAFNATTTGATVQVYDWNFDDPTNLPDFSDSADPTHEYLEDGIYNVTLSVTSDMGCVSDEAISPITIGNNPIPNYTFEQIAMGEPTIFDINESVDLGILADSIDVVNWTFTERGNGNVINRAVVNDTDNIAVSPVADVTFTSLGVKDVFLEVISRNNCTGILTDSLFIVPLEQLDATNTYQADFEGGTGDWISWGSNTSWTTSNAGGTTITGSPDVDINGKTDFWVTGTGDYNRDEISFVYSPIFDITAMDKPLLTLNTFRDALGEDGALIEYSFAGFSTNGTSDWQLLGDLDVSGGIENWYNQRDIGTFSVANLNDNPRDEGWTGSDSLWRESKQSLTEIKAGGNRFQMRIGFISSPFGDKTDGFAFDNVFIGESTRSVLIENFTNSSQTEGTKNNADILINSYINGITDNTDAIVINYHTDFPGIDLVNVDNPIDPSARALFYGFSTAPSVMIDGTVSQSGPFTTEWLVNQVGFRALDLAPFNIDIDLSVAQGNLVINANITQLLPDVGNDLLIYAAILEKDVPVSGALPSGETELRFALRKMLPNAAGLPVEVNEIGSPFEFRWSPGGDIDPNDMAVVVFIQNENTKEIYQSALRISTPVPDNITGLDDLGALSSLKVYPNPANQKVTIHFGEPLGSTIPILIYDTFGKRVYEGEAATGMEFVDVDTRDFVPGMYHVQLQVSDDQVARQRLVIIHQ